MDKACSSENYEQRRTRRLLWAVSSSLLVRPLAVLTPIIVIPLFVKSLGKEGYGAYEAIANLIIWLGFTNLGLGIGMINHLTDCFVRGDEQTARRLISSTFGGTIMLAGLLLTLGLALSWSVPWASVLNVSQASTAAAIPLAVFCAFLSVAVGMPASIITPIYTAYQEIHQSNLWDALARLVTLLACVLAATQDWGLAACVLAICVTPSLIRLANLVVYLYVRKPQFAPSAHLLDWAILLRVARDGGGFFLLMLAGAISFQTDRLVIGTLRGTGEVADFSITARLFTLGYGLYVLVIAPFWPAFGEAIKRGDVDWVNRMLKRIRLFGIAVSLAMGLGMLAAGKWIVPFLSTGQVAPPSPWLIAGFAVSCAMRSWTDTHSVVLNAGNEIWPQVKVLSITSAAALAVSVALTYTFGIAGTAWAFPVAAIGGAVWIYPRRVQALLKRHASSPAGQSVG